MQLTVHLNLKCDRRVGQLAAGVKGVLSLLMYVHSLQLQGSLVSKISNEKGFILLEKQNHL